MPHTHPPDTGEQNNEGDRLVAETPFLQLWDRKGWFFVKRPGLKGVVVIVAVTTQRELLFVEQWRPPMGSTVLELPAGLAGDEPGLENEALADAASRELLEETGFSGGHIEPLIQGPTSPGMTDENVSFFLATDLIKVGQGGGVAGEDIVVHTVPCVQAIAWLKNKNATGTPVAAKLWGGLLLAHVARPSLGIIGT